ncbi:multiple sugar transport system substrate-binding protein [Diaminobutyricimonas aerilata]|uniref:Multiple sugar transport system substrate-binding protein n=1 Tax=Diaminobutyricimonas aerilata TaxID=1162967 RepID=A0A2M9CHZ8_9MICO|nr:sugar ABC transporter substrate-binding protein [Diaminobutyricimonas aerilata]PJJ71543.1 multiple sugar transport system substrate-binding protein [Diaminobutyricimonas aerilata]
MKLTTRLATATAVLAVGALALTGCTGAGPAAGSDGPIDTSGELSGTIKFQSWSLKNEKFSPYFEDLIAAFEEEHPDVTVEWLDQPGDGYQDKVLSQANSNSLPDVVNLPPDIAYPLVAAGKLVDLAAADSSLEDQYVPGAWEAYTYPGIDGTYGLPWYLGTDLGWWNGAALQQYGADTSALPTTNEELLSLAEQVGEASGGQMPLLSSMPTIDLFASSGIEVMNDDGEFVFNTDEAAAIVDQFASAYQAGALPAEALTGDYGGNADMFKQGKVAYTTAGSGFAGDLQRDAPSIRESVIATPRIGDAPLFVQGVSVSNDSKNKAAALAFAEYLTNTENQVAFAQLALGFVPGTVDGSADVGSLSESVTDPLQKEAMEIVSESMKTARILIPFQWTSAMKTYMDQQLALALKGEVGSKEALDKVVEYANDNLVEY